MGRKRGHGEGSVYRYRGRWRAEIRIGPHRHVKDFPTRREATAWLAEVRVRAERGLLPEPCRLTLAGYLEHWLGAAAPGLRPASVETYRYLIETHVAPDPVGQARLQKLRPADIQGFYGRLLERGLSPATVRLIRGVLHKALSQAVDWGLLAVNPADRTRAPRVPRKEFRALSPDEARRLLEAARTVCPAYYPLLATLLATGMRIGEAVGLRWEDVDPEAGVIRVVRTLKYVGGRWVEGEPKSAAGKRQIPVPAELAGLLKEQRRAVLEARLKAGGAWCQEFGELVFPTARGRPVRPADVWKGLRRACKAAGLPLIRVHDLRHTHATMLLLAGEHPRVVQERLGHSQISMTLEIYSHVLPDLQAQAARKVGELLRGAF